MSLPRVAQGLQRLALSEDLPDLTLLEQVQLLRLPAAMNLINGVANSCRTPLGEVNGAQSAASSHTNCHLRQQAALPSPPLGPPPFIGYNGETDALLMLAMQAPSAISATSGNSQSSPASEGQLESSVSAAGESSGSDDNSSGSDSEAAAQKARGSRASTKKKNAPKKPKGQSVADLKAECKLLRIRPGSRTRRASKSCSPATRPPRHGMQLGQCSAGSSSTRRHWQLRWQLRRG